MEEVMKVASSYAVEAELELGLGLSLGGGGKSCKNTSGGWGESGRILTAKDFPSSMNRSNASKPSSSCAAVAISGTKRTAADSVSSHDHQGGGSPTSASQVVGWPPIRAYRMNSLVNQAKSARADHEDKSAIADQNEKSKDAAIVKNKTGAGNEKGPLGYVKVNMDGTPIGRKLDLNAHGCYETLAQTLEEMFFKPSGNPTGGEKQASKPSKLLDGSSEFVLTYEDKEGDWMLVGDVPWRMFLKSVKRLRIMRTSEANGLGPRFQERIKPV